MATMPAALRKGSVSASTMMAGTCSRRTWTSLQFPKPYVPRPRLSFPASRCVAMFEHSKEHKGYFNLQRAPSASTQAEASTVARAATGSESSSSGIDEYSCSSSRKFSVKDVGYAGFMVAIHALCLLAPFTFSWSALGVFAVLYVTTGMLGITLSYHRNLAHKSFKLPKWLEYPLAYLGAQALQGDPLEWVSIHRSHHQHCDTESDPHTPHQGFWHSHMGWLFDSSGLMTKVGQPLVNNVKDLAPDPFYAFLARTYPIHPTLLAVALYCLGGLPYLVWGMAVRIVWVYHITWSVNSAAHVWGSQQWNTGDLSRNNWWVALLAFGEGWHNNHHAFEYSARHGLEWWQLDMTWYTVRLLQVLGLATKVRLPSKEHKLNLAFPTE